MRLVVWRLCTGLVVAANALAVAATEAKPPTASPWSGAAREVTRALLLDRIHGGERVEVEGQPGYRVRLQPPRLISGL